MTESATVADHPTPTVLARRFAEQGVCLHGTGELALDAARLFGTAIAVAVAAGHRHVVIRTADGSRGGAERGAQRSPRTRP
jgi:hypothetical protein